MTEETHTRPELATPELETEAVAFFESLQQVQATGQKEVERVLGGARFGLVLPPLGEGDRGMVYRLRSWSMTLPQAHGALCLKVAKQQPVCRERLLEEQMTTAFFLGEGIAVPRIHYMDPLGRFAIKDLIEGESVTSLYLRFGSLTARTQSLVLEGLERFLTRLLELFRKRPDCQVSISPNNIYVLTEAGRFSDPLQLVLIDPGTTLKKSYEGFTFQKYWNEVLPDRVRKYQRTGYLQWLVPKEVTQSERDEAKGFEIFRDLKPSEVFLLLKVARTIEYDAEETIFTEGSIGENFFLVLEGEVELRRGHYSRPETFKVRIRPGAVVGEMAFLLHAPRSMTAVAATPCKLIEIDRERFNELMDANLTAPYKLIRNIAITLAERLHALDSSHARLLEERAGGAR
ncbi:MAG TPA: cyclic nucleotide-binding domain-containing protein [Thermoanaerobaculaceae bacterium]|nr:cyclic nucleotide-binding domain-containing protein [Thermoanaerobaculaceae bacterium]HRS14806.1 cyclic nucleotide-binding domain-containing protein [Thermoanaerobaculaceae bacterium]